MSGLRAKIFSWAVFIFYRLWTASWRLRIIEHPDFTAIKDKTRVIFALWHGDLLVMVSVGPPYQASTIVSQSKDGELITQVLKKLGFGIARGSSTRGGARAIIGMLSLLQRGYNATVTVDGPKGPRYKVKPGVLYLAKKANIPVIACGVASDKGFQFQRAWDKTRLPWPFTKVVVSFGKPWHQIEENTLEQNQELLETILQQERTVAQKELLLWTKKSLN